EDDGLRCRRASVRLPDDRPAGDEERQMMEARSTARVGSGVIGLVEEQLRAESAVGSVVERASGDGREPLSQPEYGHQLVVVLLGRGEIRHADSDVVDESGSGQ